MQEYLAIGVLLSQQRYALTSTVYSLTYYLPFPPIGFIMTVSTCDIAKKISGTTLRGPKQQERKTVSKRNNNQCDEILNTFGLVVYMCDNVAQEQRAKMSHMNRIGGISHGV